MSSRSASRTWLALRHVAFEDLGTLEPLFRDRGFRIRYIRAGAPCPSVREWLEADLCVVLGGPVGVGDTESYPYLKTELDLVRMRLESRQPLLGVCLGAQMMAHALGSRVYPGKAREIGWGTVCPLSVIWRGCPSCIGMGIRLMSLPEHACWPPRR